MITNPTSLSQQHNTNTTWLHTKTIQVSTYSQTVTSLTVFKNMIFVDDPPAGQGLHPPCTRVNRENLGLETNVEILVNPSILTNYGLSHMDLLAVIFIVRIHHSFYNRLQF